MKNNEPTRFLAALILGRKNNETATMDVSKMQRYTAPVNPAVFPHLTTILLGMGMFFTTWFFIFVVSKAKNSKERTLPKELMLALCASIFLGCGLIFLLLSVGIYI